MVGQKRQALRKQYGGPGYWSDLTQSGRGWAAMLGLGVLRQSASEEVRAVPQEYTRIVSVSVDRAIVWLLLGAVLLLVGGYAWWVIRRRDASSAE